MKKIVRLAKEKVEAAKTKVCEFADDNPELTGYILGAAIGGIGFGYVGFLCGKHAQYINDVKVVNNCFKDMQSKYISFKDSCSVGVGYGDKSGRAGLVLKGTDIFGKPSKKFICANKEVVNDLIKQLEEAVKTATN